MKEPVKDDRLLFEAREAAIQRLRQRFAHLPAGVSLADELIAERRDEARREDQGA